MCVSVILGFGGLDNRAPTYNCGILVSWEGGSGDPRRKWESDSGRESVEKCCFCLQNDLKEPWKCKKCINCLSKSMVYGIYRDYQKSRT